jgi:hypothetical protein
MSALMPGVTITMAMHIDYITAASGSHLPNVITRQALAYQPGRSTR